MAQTHGCLFAFVFLCEQPNSDSESESLEKLNFQFQLQERCVIDDLNGDLSVALWYEFIWSSIMRVKHVIIDTNSRPLITVFASPCTFLA